MHRKTLWTTLFFLFQICLFGQSKMAGIVADENNEPLAFVNILINENYQNGVATDINGQFKIETNEPIQSLTLTYVGYEKLVYKITETTNTQNLLIQLKSSTTELRETIVIAGENPAHRIIRKVVANRDLHHPEKIAAFQCQTYNKVTFEFIPNEEGIQNLLKNTKTRTVTLEKIKLKITKMLLTMLKRIISWLWNR